MAGEENKAIRVRRESRRVSRLEGDPLKGVALTGYAALFRPPRNISSESADLTGNRQAGRHFCPDVRTPSAHRTREEHAHTHKKPPKNGTRGIHPRHGVGAIAE